MHPTFATLGLVAALVSGPVVAASQSASDVDWTLLPELLGQLPPPPQSVAETQRYHRDIEHRLDSIEQAVERYEDQLERMNDRLNELSERDVRQQFSETERQGRAAAERLARQTGSGSPQSPSQNQSEETRMRETLPGGTLPQVPTGPLNTAVQSFAFQSASIQSREEQQAQRLSDEWQAADARCDDNEHCVKAEEQRHLSKRTVLKDKFLHDSRRAWGQLKSAADTFNEKTKVAMRTILEGGNTLMRASDVATHEVFKFTIKLEPIRILVGALGLLVNSSRQQWEDSNTVREQMENLGPQAAGGTAGSQ